MLPFLRRNTTAGTEAEVVENEEWVDPVEKAVREVGWQAPRPSLPSVKPQHTHSHSFSSLPTSSTPAAPPPDPPPRTDMYLARAPPPQKHSSGWLSYMFGTTPGHIAGETPKEEERPLDPVERRTSNVSAEPVLPGTFPVVPRHESVDAGKREELVRGGGRLGGPIAEPVKPKAPLTTTPALVLPSTYVKPAPAITKSTLNSARPTTFASTLASPPVITGTPAYGLSSARGRDGLTEAERVRKEWQDAQKEARKAKRREERQRLREQEREAARNESRIQQIIIPQPVIVPSHPVTHAQRFMDQHEQAPAHRTKRARRANGTSAPGNTDDTAGGSQTRTHHSHHHNRPAETGRLLRQASMRRRNVWDDLGDGAVTEGPAPPAFEARQRGASSLGRVVEGQEDARPDFDPNDPPPPFPEDASPLNGTAQRPRSPPPSFEVAVAQLQVNAQLRRASSIRSSSDRSDASVDDDGPWTEDEERLMEERAAWEKDIADGLSFEERLAKVAARMEALEASANEENVDHATSGDNDANIPVNNEAPANHDSRNDDDIAQRTSEDATADIFVEAEPIPRFSKEEKGKGKAVDEHKGEVRKDKAVEERNALGLASAVDLGAVDDQLARNAKPVSAPSGPVMEEIERPSRSYIAQSPRKSTNLIQTIHTDKTTESPGPASITPVSPAYERPLPALPQPLFHRKPSSGRESNPWKLLRKMSSAGPPSPAVDPSASPPQSPSLSQRQNSDSWSPDRQSLGRTTSNVDERPKSARRPSALSRMTSQLFKPNLGLEPGIRAERSGSEDREKTAEDEKVEELQSPSPKVASLPLAESPTATYSNRSPETYTRQLPNQPYIAPKHPFNRAVKPAWMQAGLPISQDSRAVILNGPERPKPHVPVLPERQEIPTSAAAVEPSPEPTPQQVKPQESVTASRLPLPPPIPIRNPLPAKDSVEAMPPPKLATQPDEGSETDSNLTASNGSEDTEDDSEDDSSSTSSSSSAAEVMAKRRVSTYRLLPPRGIPLEVLRSSEPPPPIRHGERKERARPHGPRTRDPPPLPPRPHAIAEESVEEVEPAVVVTPVSTAPPASTQATRVVPPPFRPQRSKTSQPVIDQAAVSLQPAPKIESTPKPEPTTEPPTTSPLLPSHEVSAELTDAPLKRAPPPVPPRKPHARKPSTGKPAPVAMEPIKEPTLQERIMASLLPEAPSHERSLSRDLPESIRASIVPANTAEPASARTRPASYKPIGGATTPQTAPVFQTAKPKRKTGNGTPAGRLNIRPRFDDRPDLELKSQLALRVNRWRMKEVPWTREEIEEELRRMAHQVEDDDPMPPKVERTQSSPEIPTQGMGAANVGSGRIRNNQLPITSTPTADSGQDKYISASEAQTSPKPQAPTSPAQLTRQITPKEPLTSASHQRSGSVQQVTSGPSQAQTVSQRPQAKRVPTVEYTDLDLAAARLEGTADEFEGIHEITSFVSENGRRGATPSELSNLFIAPVEVESRRTTKEGKTKLKLSALGVRVLKCSVCLNQFRSGDMLAMMPNCGHVGHQKCVVDWLTRDARCMVCRQAL